MVKPWSIQGSSVSTQFAYDWDTDNDGSQAPDFRGKENWDVQTPDVAARIASDGGNFALFHINFELDKSTDTVNRSPAIGRHVTPDLENIEDGINTYLAAGVTPIIYPTVILPDFAGSQLAPERYTPSNTDAWFNSYGTHIKELAELSGKYNLPYMSIGCGLGPIATATYTQQWDALIAEVRESYSGNLWYSNFVNAHYARETDDDHNSDDLKNLGMVDHLSHIGFNLYTDLVAGDDGTFEDFIAGWSNSYLSGRNLITEVQNLAKSLPKPIIMTEFGYSALDGSANSPLRRDLERPFDYQEQADAFKAWLQTWMSNGEDWLEGVFAWDLEPDFNTNNGILNEVPDSETGLFLTANYWNHPAHDILTQAFQGTLTGTGITKIGTDTDETLTAGFFDDNIIMGAGNDIGNGKVGNDTLTGGAGDDTLNGGDGTDIAIFSGIPSEYSVQETGKDLIITDNQAGRDGVDSLFSIETLQFSNGVAQLTDLVRPEDIDRGIYRFFNVDTGTHFLSGSTVERDSVINNLDAFNFEGPTFRAADPTNAAADTVFRFFNTQTGTHFFTQSTVERDNILDTIPQFSFEGEAYKGYTEQVDGSIPLYRFFNTQTGTHFYTAAEAEKDSIIANLPSFNFEGTAYWVDPVMG